MRRTITAVAVLFLAITGVAIAATSTSLSDGDPQWNYTESQDDLVTQDGDWVLQTKDRTADAGIGDISENGHYIKGSGDGGTIYTASDGEAVWEVDDPIGPSTDVQTTHTVSVFIDDLDSGAKVEFRDGSGTTIQTYTKSDENGQYIDSDFTYQTDSDLNLRIYVIDDSDSVQVSIGPTYEWTARDGTLRVSNGSSYLELSEIASLGTLTVNGTDNADSQTTFRVERRSDGKTICSVQGVESSTTDLASACPDWDTANPDNAYLKFYFDVSRLKGATGDTIADWRFSYEKDTDVPQVQVKEALIGGYETNGDEGTSYVGSDDEFTVADTDTDIQEVQWYINGQRVERQDVSGRGPFTLDREWQSGGTKFIRADLYSASSGAIGSTSWTVNVQQVAINGKDAYTVEPGQSFVVQQTFESESGEDLSVEILWDDSVVKQLSGPTETTVGDGNSVQWEFLVEESNYEGQPVTIVAESERASSTTKIRLSTTDQGGVLFTSGDNRNRIAIVGAAGAAGIAGVQYFYGLPKLLGQLGTGAGWVIRKIGGVF